MGLMLVSIVAPLPPPGLADVADDGLAARIDVHMLDRDLLFAAAPDLGQAFHLGRVGPQELNCQRPVFLQVCPGPANLALRSISIATE
jgi:hypothetical protein